MTENTLASEAETVARDQLAKFESLSFEEAAKIPRAEARDIVVANKEVQMTVFRQNGIPDIEDAVLITVQISRASLGGIVNFQHEQGLVVLPQGGSR